uniref:Neurogenic mastermind-like N-terminal domain-containing protein n=1 Tax=Anas platyrhynchos TaxID=8839 RepID=A0A8B9R1H1_ANAPL
MGDTAPPQAQAAGLGAGLLGGGGGGPAAPRVHSAIVERLRARIAVCRQHHLSCEGRYERGRAESSDRERESTLQLLHLVQQGQGARKAAKHPKAAAGGGGGGGGEEEEEEERPPRPPPPPPPRPPTTTSTSSATAAPTGSRRRGSSEHRPCWRTNPVGHPARRGSARLGTGRRTAWCLTCTHLNCSTPCHVMLDALKICKVKSINHSSGRKIH